MSYIRHFPEDSAFRQAAQGPEKSDAATKADLSKKLSDARKGKASEDGLGSVDTSVDTSTLDGVSQNVHDIP